MKKLLAVTLVGTILLSSCGNITKDNDEKTHKNETKSSKNEDGDYNKELRKYFRKDIPTLDRMFKYMSSHPDEAANPQDTIDAYKQYAKEIDDNLKIHKDNLKNFKANGKEKIVGDYFITLNEVFSTYLKGIIKDLEKIQSGQDTNPEVYKHMGKLSDKFNEGTNKVDEESEKVSDSELKKIIGNDLYKKYNDAMSQ
ncbi:hypothetical protein [Mammaliicoccus sp. Dog046]|uniref:hypothetical protein n=1 Tax=Mammaliicoccus sp. Dog046 TaxID=3034233 RepID=UPI002B261ED6|nr:hypothetical protein [Mammaliicoccus sp. Dog046]WQK84790.1 hypothetical protein P3U32_09145 [Mammaliicoccus sp. Dog046]